MTDLSYSEMEMAIKKRFAGVELLCNSEYSALYPKNEGFWIRGSENIRYTDKDRNTLYLSNDYENKSYELNIYKKFDAWCKARGWFATSENYTLQIFKL